MIDNLTAQTKYRSIQFVWDDIICSLSSNIWKQKINDKNVNIQLNKEMQEKRNSSKYIKSTLNYSMEQNPSYTNTIDWLIGHGFLLLFYPFYLVTSVSFFVMCSCFSELHFVGRKKSRYLVCCCLFCFIWWKICGRLSINYFLFQSPKNRKLMNVMSIYRLVSLSGSLNERHILLRVGR